jgi:DMSO/TMAO reductase YedYZ heme-binding membrane subunit
MKTSDLNYPVSLLLLLFLAATGLAGYIQVRLDLHRFVYHRWLAYGTLVLGAVHLLFNIRKLVRYLTRR